MTTTHAQFSIDLVKYILNENQEISAHPDDPSCLLLKNQAQEWVSLNLTPVVLRPGPVTAKKYFSKVGSFDDLLNAYQQARSSLCFENDIHEAMAHVDCYADDFMKRLFAQAKSCTSEQARLIAGWVQNLDIYTAVKATESLLNSKADLTLLEVAHTRDWQVHFDHIAIRCGNQENQDAERIVEMLVSDHNYSACQIKTEQYYSFPDGWNAYLLYKILDNGQMLRLFIDQSAKNHTEQIIQHWNHIYGYTAHHMAIRATNYPDKLRKSISLDEVSKALQKYEQNIMTATGHYTLGLLEQVFTRPEQNNDIPADLLQKITLVNPKLSDAIVNGKLLEIVSRKELPELFKSRYFELYGLHYDSDNPLHSVPIYNYFLPAQAAHVIKTSIETL